MPASIRWTCSSRCRRARELGLWNLCLPGLREDEPGTRLTNLDYAPLAETMGRLPWSAEVFNCNAPDSGNMELLQRFADAGAARTLARAAAGGRSAPASR